MRKLCGLAMLLALAACGPRGERALPASGGFSAELGIDTMTLVRTASGLRFVDVAKGQGEEASAGRVATVHYTGWLTDGKKFDSSRDRGEPFSFAIGAQQVIAGWDEGVAGMRVGGRRKLVIPPDLGYGAAGAPPDIPPNAVLVFDVELMDVK
jgi:FKBP-type peptidyl-prolyl cis-trans isomerase FkpA